MLTVGCVAATVGCDKGPATAKVSGKVFYKDGTVPRGGVCTVQFLPVAGSTAAVRSAASGVIESDGSFVLARRKAGDGVYLGDYSVIFAVWRNPLDPSTSMIAPKYGSPAMTPYKITVEHDVSDLKYEIEPLPSGATGTPAAAAPAAPAPAAEAGSK
jgi:hypothetical protein